LARFPGAVEWLLVSGKAESGGAWRSGLAALFGLALPGAGHLAVGRPAPAAAWLVSDTLVRAGGLLLAVRLRIDRWAVLVPLLLFLAFRLAAAVHAGLVAWRGPRLPRRKLLALASAALAVIVAWYALAWLPVASVLRDHVAEAFRIPAGGMAPTVLPGDRILADKTRHGAPRRFDLVVVRAPGFEGEPERYLRRVIGLPGETVEYRDGLVRIDGSPLSEPEREPEPDGGAYGPTRVPEGHYWLLGDNRSGSVDSRMPRFGFVPREHILARAAVIYASWDPMSGEVRWNRFGRVLR